MTETGLQESFGRALAGALAFLGVLGAALKFWPKQPERKAPEKGEDMTAWIQHVNETMANHSTRLNQFERQREKEREEQRADFGKVFDELRGLSAGVARMEGALSTREGKR